MVKYLPLSFILGQFARTISRLEKFVEHAEQRANDLEIELSKKEQQLRDVEGEIKRASNVAAKFKQLIEE